MNKLIVTRFFLIFALLAIVDSQPSVATVLRASCYKMDQDGQSIQGVHYDDKIEMGSVSKVFTSYWALSTRGVQYRFQTGIYAVPVSAPNVNGIGGDLWDIHLVGSRDPEFGKVSLQFIVARLNEQGIKRIRTLSFDENFKYIDSPEVSSTAESSLHTQDPQPVPCLETQPNNISCAPENTVSVRLRNAFNTISYSYPQLTQIMAQNYNVKLPKTISMSVDDIVFTPSNSSLPSGVEGMRIYSYNSRPMLTILKEMNRNSNNYAANNIFESMGGQIAFAPFIKSRLGLTERDVSMLNGSGDRYDENPALGKYNEATCQAILQVLHGLRTVLKQSGAGFSLQDALAVVGKDQGATVNIYENDITTGTVVAKTGTVNPGVALAGMANTKDGAIIFASLYGPGDTLSQREAGRAQIRSSLNQLITSHGGGVQLPYTSKAFFPLNGHSELSIMSGPLDGLGNKDKGPGKVNNLGLFVY